MVCRMPAGTKDPPCWPRVRRQGRDTHGFVLRHVKSSGKVIKKNKVVYGNMCDRGQEKVLDEDEKDDEEERGRR